MVKNPTVHFFKMEGRGVYGEIPKDTGNKIGFTHRSISILLSYRIAQIVSHGFPFY